MLSVGAELWAGLPSIIPLEACSDDGFGSRRTPGADLLTTGFGSAAGGSRRAAEILETQRQRWRADAVEAFEDQRAATGRTAGAVVVQGRTRWQRRDGSASGFQIQEFQIRFHVAQ
jgi:hypothetical protein